MYAPLFCKSNYSFLEGASHPGELVEAAHRMGIESLAVTDRDGVYGIVRAHVRARELGVHLVIGSQVSVGEDGEKLQLLATNEEGYANVCRLLTKGRLRCEKGKSKVFWPEVAGHAEGVIALWSGDGDPALLKDAFGDRLYALIARHREADEVLREKRLREIATAEDIPTVAAVETLYHTPARRPLQDVLSCLRHGVTLATAGRFIRANDHHTLLAPFAFDALFEDDPGSIERTREVAERCRFSLGDIRYRYPSERLPDGKTSSEWLRDLTFRGARERYPDGVPASVRALVLKELALIDELDYCGYFLTMWEIVELLPGQHGILCQGRGSAANSAVCYCLGVTAVDPTRVDLCCSSASCRSERARAAGHRPRHRARAARGGDPARLRRSTAATAPRWWRTSSASGTRSAVREVGKALGMPGDRLWTGWPRWRARYARRRSTRRMLRPAALGPRERRRAPPPRAALVERDPGLSAPPLDPPRWVSCWGTSR